MHESNFETFNNANPAAMYAPSQRLRLSRGAESGHVHSTLGVRSRALSLSLVLSIFRGLHDIDMFYVGQTV